MSAALKQSPTFSGAHTNRPEEVRGCARGAARQVKDGKMTTDDLREVLRALAIEGDVAAQLGGTR